MTFFWIFAALLLGGALAFLLPPLLRRHASASRADREIENARIYREELAELDRERATGALSEAQYAAAKLEIERRLIEDIAVAPAQPGGAQPNTRWAALAVALIVPIAAVLVYLRVGNPDALDPARLTRSDPQHSITPERVAAFAEQLAARLAQSPDDAGGWVLLARSYRMLGRNEESANAFARAVKLVPNDAGLLADYADMLAITRGRMLDGEPYELVKRALRIEPNHIKALALAGSAEFERKNYRAAVAYWDRLLAQVPADSEFAHAVRASLEEARDLGKLSLAPAEGDAAAITGTVKLAAALAAQVEPNDTLFVFARAAEGPRMPLAIVRVKAGELPYEFRLDDRSAMTPNTRLSGQARVLVGARISRSGNATPQPGDLQATSPPVAPGTRGLELTIDQVVK
jgi:cytochrome c-type biogenesis protein CcmH